MISKLQKIVLLIKNNPRKSSHLPINMSNEGGAQHDQYIVLWS